MKKSIHTQCSFSSPTEYWQPPPAHTTSPKKHSWISSTIVPVPRDETLTFSNGAAPRHSRRLTFRPLERAQSLTISRNVSSVMWCEQEAVANIPSGLRSCIAYEWISSYPRIALRTVFLLFANEGGSRLIT